MTTEFLRDQHFTTAWFGLMAFVWFGWAQEDPPKAWRGWLGLGSGLGVVIALGFGALTGLNWGEPTALEGRYGWFGLLVAVEVVAAGVGGLVLARRRASRWTAWWVAAVVAAHFLPLAVLLEDWAVAVVGFAQLALLCSLLPRLRRDGLTSSRLVGPVMGATLLLSAVVGAVAAVAR
ncbi:hypothetical protein IOD16_10840 [Saccharothrix sp. 6-C]|uniref:hypothetical protein n=1 Tax=Saccharothrix sp. 6-C TaxID=2781735 RepID=UPI0019173B56|nr:hypothetical protein [Saccharothrix sp. 6-C]QQQ78874.1 hypothetical protein IOD16_10840 [Saccharothrix sp. 6-C]